ncbi:oligosaccharide repeat unit polymerase [Rhodococcus hoagii]|nr:oligosaccharide repeat unit polymerase [Prescottella equi]NKT15611.1 oligosaccharide repeat unit polymerase [Prescottella equi]NKW47570.1 oligosaccharide repeat unit polymerase [Prescottella equi]
MSIYIRLPWWLNPLWAAALFVGMITITGLYVSADSFQLWRVPMYVSSELTLIGLVPAVAFLVGLSVPMLRRSGRSREFSISLSPRTLLLCDKLSSIFFWLTVVGYVLWVLFALRQGAGLQQLRSVLSFEQGSVGELKKLSAPVGGLTTLTQFAPVAVALRAFLLRIDCRGRRAQLVTILLLSLARSFLYGERLALIEVAVPALIVMVAVSAVPHAKNRSFAAAVLPVFAIPALWTVFAVFEYSRSWLYYRTVTDQSFFQYINDRLLGYYVTAINNSSLYYLNAADVPHDPLFSFPAVWDAPIIGEMLGAARISGVGIRTWWDAMLSFNGNPEFNNVGTFLVVDADLGTAGAVVYWLAFGVAVGFCFQKARQGRIVGLIAYSVVFVGLLEIVRIVYWAQGRFTPVIIALAVLYFVLSPSQRRDSKEDHAERVQ